MNDAQIRPVATAFLRARPWIVAPFLGFTVAALGVGGARRAQVVAVVAMGTLALSFFSYERWRGRRQLVSATGFLRSLVVTLAALTVACAGTGGMESPILPMLFAPSGVGFAAFGRSRAGNVLFAVVAVAVAVLVGLTPFVSALVVPEPARRLVLGAAILCASILLFLGVAGLTSAHARAADTLAAAGEEMLRASRARAREVETLGARVAHELKNPLAAVRALVEVMLESASEADEKTRKRLTVAASEVARAERIVTGYASAARPLDVVERRDADVSDVVASLVAVLEARARAAGVELAAEGPSPLVFAIDAGRVKEALLNLLLNAIEATPPGGCVVVAWERTFDGALALRVTDSGCGMDAALLERVGNPFFSTKPGGTGLGVAHARRVAEQHGGRLCYAGAPRGGTVATLEIY